jgi:xanthine dehydrogenase small subunit
MNNLKDQNRIDFLINEKILPEYFTSIFSRLTAINQKAATNGATTSKEKFYFTGGGTDLYVQRPEEMKYADCHFVSGDDVMQSIKEKNGICIIGGSVTVTALLESSIFKKHFTGITEFIKLISSTPIRNMATVGGNFVNASPIGDLTIFFLALDAKLVLINGVEERKILLKDFYKGYKSLDKSSEEYIGAVEFVLPGKNCYFNFEKVSKRTHLDIASVNTAISLKLSGTRITDALLSAGGVGPTPMLLKNASAFLIDKELDIFLVEECIEKALGEISPMGDARGTAIYKSLLLAQLIKAHFITLFPEMNFSEMIKTTV